MYLSMLQGSLPVLKNLSKSFIFEYKLSKSAEESNLSTFAISLKDLRSVAEAIQVFDAEFFFQVMKVNTNNKNKYYLMNKLFNYN